MGKMNVLKCIEPESEIILKCENKTRGRCAGHR